MRDVMNLYLRANIVKDVQKACLKGLKEYIKTKIKVKNHQEKVKCILLTGLKIDNTGKCRQEMEETSEKKTYYIEKHIKLAHVNLISYIWVLLDLKKKGVYTDISDRRKRRVCFL
ncbi:MAG TPA: hypothetical protein GX526_03020 [Thermoanaerobacterales bacterium]|nr:hypothetical protein [Thermoanaerobacterales bacterium]